MRLSAKIHIIACLCAAIAAGAQTPTRSIHGVVHDQTGAIVAAAHVTVQGAGYRQFATSSAGGDFKVENAPQGPLTLEVDAAGFSHFEEPLSPEQVQADVELKPQPVSQEVNVTANRSDLPLSDTAESVSLISRGDIDTTAGEAADQILSQVPGFTLFRRSSSIFANPTTQGVSLRGIGTSGASRALVEYDGVPLNDPFGGWVYWGRIPNESIGSIEVLRGGASSLYGSGALSGVINILPENPEQDLFSAEGSFGTEGTPDFSATNSLKAGKWILDTNGEVFRTGGYVLVPPADRGAVDVPINSYDQALADTVRRKFNSGDAFVTGSLYNDVRDNGTPVQKNDTQLWQISGGTNLATPIGSFQLRGFGGGESFNQTFSSVAANRDSEFLVDAQHVPSSQIGASLLWSRQFGQHNSLVAGADTDQVHGFSNEETFSAVSPTSHLSAGGTQLLSGVFVQDLVRITSRLLLTLGGRYDNWDNFDAQTQTVPLVSTIKPNFTAFPDVNEHAFSPRAALLYSVNHHLSLTGSAYKSFRAPTLNELYRSFRLGNTITDANSNLTAERLAGVEGGANMFFGRTRIHTDFFWMRITDPIESVVLSSTPALITQQRQNLGSTRSRGVEADVEWRFKKLLLNAGYQYVDAVVTSFSSQPALVGLEVPQVAPHQFTAQASYSFPGGWTAALQTRAASMQFDDSLNQFPLDAFFQLDGYISKRIRRGLEMFVAAQNLTDSRVVEERTPLVNVGPPIFVRVGLKMQFE